MSLGDFRAFVEMMSQIEAEEYLMIAKVQQVSSGNMEARAARQLLSHLRSRARIELPESRSRGARVDQIAAMGIGVKRAE